jgi:uncharacterized protein
MDLSRLAPADCEGPLHPMAIRGFQLFNQGQYWLAHEALEEAWRDELGQVRRLYQGILQAGVVYLHIQRGNWAGAMKVYHRSQRWLSPFPDTCRGIDLARLRADLDRAITEARRLGPEGLDLFDPFLLKPLVWNNPSTE